MAIEAVNPATGELIKKYDEMPPAQVAAIVDEAHAAWQHWRRLSFAERAIPMRKAATHSA